MHTSNFQPIKLLDPDCSYKFTYLTANSSDPGQLASLDVHCLQRQGISEFSRTRVNVFIRLLRFLEEKKNQQLQECPSMVCDRDPLCFLG